MKKNNWFRRAFLKVKLFVLSIIDKAHKVLQKSVPVGIEVVELLKEVVDNPAIPFLTKLTATTADDAAVALAKTLLPKILVQLKIADKCVKLTDRNAVLQCAIEQLRQLDPLEREKAWFDISSMLSYYLSKDSEGGEKLTWSEIAMVVKTYYDEIYKKQNKK